MNAPFAGLGGRSPFVMGRRHVGIAVAVVLGAMLLAGVISIVASPSRSRPHSTAPPRALSPPVSPQSAAGQSSSSPGWTAVPPLTVVPPDTPVQQQYDEALSSGLSASSSGLQAAETTPVPAPAFSPAWPALAEANTPEQWTTEFTERLLDIDFAQQSRAGLGQWLSAEEAPELLPGIPPEAAGKVLYLSLFDAAGVGGSSSPIPDEATWAADARAGIRWTVSDVVVQEDSQFSQVLAAGWEPEDQRFAAEDVSGLLTISHGASRMTRHFSMGVYVGSANWHQGYGTVLVTDWTGG